MRCFYREYEKMHFQLYKEDVLKMVKQDEAFQNYSMEALIPDLEALVKWKNLTPIQDPGKVYTIADYKNKQYRYTMSEYAVEIERLTVRLENLFLESGNLSTNFFIRLEKSLEDMEQIGCFVNRSQISHVNISLLLLYFLSVCCSPTIEWASSHIRYAELRLVLLYYILSRLGK